MQQPPAQALARLSEADDLVDDETDEQRRETAERGQRRDSFATGISSGSTIAIASRWRLSVWMLRQRKATWASR